MPTVAELRKKDKLEAQLNGIKMNKEMLKKRAVIAGKLYDVKEIELKKFIIDKGIKE